MVARLIRLSSQSMGHTHRVRVYVYDTLDEMRTAATRWSPSETFDNAAAVTHSYFNADETEALPVIRLARDHLGTEVISHEMHHAVTVLYGVTLDKDARARDVLTNHNEDFAYLYGRLFRHLVTCLYRHGYY